MKPLNGTLDSSALPEQLSSENLMVPLTICLKAWFKYLLVQ
jgi:hypothetical protein